MTLLTSKVVGKGFHNTVCVHNVGQVLLGLLICILFCFPLSLNTSFLLYCLIYCPHLLSLFITYSYHMSTCQKNQNAVKYDFLQFEPIKLMSYIFSFKQLIQSKRICWWLEGELKDMDFIFRTVLNRPSGDME